MTEQETDVLIIGGGLIGASLLLALRGAGYRTLMIEAQPYSDTLRPDFDARTLALSPASATILDMLGLWPLLAEDTTAIDTIHVSEQFRFGTAQLNAKPHEPLGYVVELQVIHRALHRLLQPNQLLAPAQLIRLDAEQGLATVLYGQEERVIKTRLLVAADGGQSTVRRLTGLSVRTKNYNQHALVANIGLGRDHNQCAYERFTATGPLAMLPMTHRRAAMIWCMPPDEAQRLQALDERSFLRHLQRTFGYKLGRLVKAGHRTTFPLRQVTMPQKADWPLVFVGNAAQTLHPVAGQGFNLGLRDVAALAQCLIQNGIQPAALSAYVTMRHHDQTAVTRLTDGLIRVFGSRLPGLGTGRSFGLMVMNQSPFLKSLLSHYARGYAGIVPDLVCGIGLDKERADATDL
ncbi:FAD-dependent monooxygenase [Legionella spiritensis]|uniref:2-octaprenyl-6-methoxyphenol hydroxylase n=1 Tax=Legionella spiritensis TaxID=452 RepID=A0A0W0YWF7_LEGSP|nr:FAD-dependent monooxygenase [Legionella spiritensis]KTD61207.1 2-octaprenyl-6-methoxyphenol hydroxylase [Legionella spiritensis]SNV28250.1 2-octaprenyl-6-methoxyphenol hydroxylase [Legionella spiritensis]